jgi:hypothetical protein
MKLEFTISLISCENIFTYREVIAIPGIFFGCSHLKISIAKVLNKVRVELAHSLSNPFNLDTR